MYASSAYNASQRQASEHIHTHTHTHTGRHVGKLLVAKKQEYIDVGHDSGERRNKYKSFDCCLLLYPTSSHPISKWDCLETVLSGRRRISLFKPFFIDNQTNLSGSSGLSIIDKIIHLPSYSFKMYIAFANWIKWKEKLSSS